MAICRLLIHDCLMAGLKVLNTALKYVGLPVLQTEPTSTNSSVHFHTS